MPRISSIFKKEHVRRVTICGMKRADHRGGWMRRRNGAASPGTRLRAHSCRRACPRVHPLPLSVISLARTCPRRSQLHIPPKQCARARVLCPIAQACICAPFRYQSRVQTSGDNPREIFPFELRRGNARECIRAHTRLPGAPPFDLQNFISGTCLSNTCFMFVFLLSDVFGTRALYFFFCYTCFNDTCLIFMFVFLMLTIPRSFYFSECEILTALPNFWAPSFLRASHGR